MVDAGPAGPAGRTEALAQFIAGSAHAEWPDAVLELGRRHLLDTIAAIVLCGERQVACAARDLALRLSGGVTAGAPILGTALRASLPDAVFASAMTAHGAEINDFCPSAFVQPGPAVVSTALCCASIDRPTGARLLRAVIAGYELTCRFPKALGIRNGRRLGYSSHGYGPVFGAAATLASLRGYSTRRIHHVLSYCAQQASGSMQWLLDVDHMEKSFVFAGMPARNGVHAALLAETGFTGVPDALDVAGGWFTSGLFDRDRSDFDPAYLIDALGVRFELPLVAYKRYPVGGPVQPVVEAMLSLVRRVRAADVDRIEVEMPGAVHVFAAAAMPALNLPYLCSLILVDGELTFAMADSRERMAKDAEIRQRMERVHVSHDASQEASPRKESARVTVRLRDGRSEVEYVDHVRGYPSNPMSAEDVECKARAAMRDRLGSERTERLIDLVRGLDQLPDAGVIADAMVARADA